eukprot:g172.t1
MCPGLTTFVVMIRGSLMKSGHVGSVFNSMIRGTDPSAWHSKESPQYKGLTKKEQHEYDLDSAALAGTITIGLSLPQATKELRAALAVGDQTDGVALMQAVWALRREGTAKARRELSKRFSNLRQLQGETVDEFLLRFSSAEQRMDNANIPRDESLTTQILLDGLTTCCDVRRHAADYLDQPGMDADDIDDAKRRSMLMAWLGNTHGAVTETKSVSCISAVHTSNDNTSADTAHAPRSDPLDDLVPRVEPTGESLEHRIAALTKSVKQLHEARARKRTKGKSNRTGKDSAVESTICRNWNAAKRCNRGDRCRFRHVCFECGSKKHGFSTCPQVRNCLKCGSAAHKTEECTKMDVAGDLIGAVTEHDSDADDRISRVEQKLDAF